MPLMKLSEGLDGPIIVNTDDMVGVLFTGSYVEILMRNTEHRFFTKYKTANEVAAELGDVENMVTRNVDQV